MARATDFEIAVRHATAKRHGTLKDDLVRLREDAGLTRALLARTAGVDAAYLGRIEGGHERPTIETYQRLASALGADLHARMYPNTGPAIHDRHQARMLELALHAAHPRWERFTEVVVTHPVRGSIDLGLYARPDRLFVATEIESELRRFEQHVRWSIEKIAALPSWNGWTQIGDEPRTSQLLIVRRTRVTRAVVAELQRQVRSAYPAHPDDALAALTGTAAWPGAALVWAVLEGRRSRLVGSR